MSRGGARIELIQVAPSPGKGYYNKGETLVAIMFHVDGWLSLPRGDTRDNGTQSATIKDSSQQGTDNRFSVNLPREEKNLEIQNLANKIRNSDRIIQ